MYTNMCDCVCVHACVHMDIITSFKDVSRYVNFDYSYALIFFYILYIYISCTFLGSFHQLIILKVYIHYDLN